MKFEFGNNMERHPYRPLSEAEKQGLTEEEIFRKEYGLYTDFVYHRKCCLLYTSDAADE